MATATFLASKYLENLFDDPAVELSKTFVTPEMEVAQLILVKAHRM